VQTKNQFVSEYTNENLSIDIVLNPFLSNSSRKCNFCGVKLVPQHLFVNNFLTKGMQTKNRLLSECANKNLSIKILSNQFDRSWEASPQIVF